MKDILIITIFLFCLKQSFSQRFEERYQLIDDFIYIDYKTFNILDNNNDIEFFNHSTPSISDPKGNFLFYISKDRVFNRIRPIHQNYNTMKNGLVFELNSALLGLNDLLILPQPQNSCNYYIFQSDASIYNDLNDNIIQGYQYHLINMGADNGKGEVISKNNHLRDSACSAIGAIPSKDKKAYWVFSISYPELCIEVHKFTKNGVRKTQYTYCYLEHIDIGERFQIYHRKNYGLPYVEMKMSPTNDKFAIAGTELEYYTVKIFKFDNETGKIEFDYELKNNQIEGLNRITFTEDGKYLYFGHSIYDLTKETPEEIQETEYIIDEIIWGIDLNPFNNVCALIQSEEFNNTLQYVILDFDGINLNIERVQHNSLNNSFFLNYHNTFPLHPYEYLNNLNTTITITKEGKTKYCSGEDVFISTDYEPKFDDVSHRWYDDEGNVVGIKDLIIEDVSKDDEGWYYYEIVAECNDNSKRDSVYIEIQVLEPVLSSPKTTFCTGESTTISLDTLYSEILWNTGEATQDIVVKESGTYSATVTEGNCTNDASIVINVKPLPEIEFTTPNGTLLCDGGSIEVVIETNNKTEVIWNDNSRLKIRLLNEAGTYTVTARDIETGCEITEEIVIQGLDDVEANILGNTTFCDGESTTLTIEPTGDSYLWSTGETTQSIVVNESGIYSATVTTEAGCEVDAERKVEKLPLPEFEILGEKIICNNEVEIYPNKDFKTYEWSNGKTSKTISINQIGTYSLTVTDDNGCSSTQEVEITEATPDIILSSNTINYDEILFGEQRIENISADRNFIITKNTTLFQVEPINNNLRITFNPTDIGLYEDYIVIESTGDCIGSATITITGVCKAEILASVSNSEGYPGDFVSNQLSLELQQQIPLPIDFEYDITLSINQDAITISNPTTFNYEDGKLVIDLNEEITKQNYTTDIDNIESKILLAKNRENPLEIINFTTDHNYLIPLRKDGNIKIYEVCLYEERFIKLYNEAIIQKISKTQATLNTFHAGKYEIEIADIGGKTITKKAITTEIDQTINFNYNLSNGTYIFKITEPGKMQTRKIMFVE